MTCRSSSSCSNSASESLFPAQQSSTLKLLQPSMSCFCHRQQQQAVFSDRVRLCSNVSQAMLSYREAKISDAKPPPVGSEEMVCLLFRVIVSFLSSLFTALGSVTFDLTCSWVSTPMSGESQRCLHE